MQDPFAWFWTIMIWGSIVWYGYLLFHVGKRGGQDIICMARTLAEKKRVKDQKAAKPDQD